MNRRGLVLCAVAVTALVSAPAAHAGEIAIGVTTATPPKLVLFDTDAPGTLIASHPIESEPITGLDMRPATGEVFATTSFTRLLALDPQSGGTTPLAGPAQLGTTSPPFNFNTTIGIEFNPTTDRLRLVNVDDDNMRVNPMTYAPIDGDIAAGIQPDADLAFAAADANFGADPNVAAEAYARNDSDPATNVTTLFGIDPALNILLTQGGPAGSPSPNGGQLFTLGSLGVDVTTPAAMDIVPGAAGSPADGVAYLAAVAVGDTGSTLYDADIVPTPAGQLTSLGAIAGDPLAAMTIALGGGLGFGTTSTVASEADAQVVVTVKRSGKTLSATAPPGGAVQVPFKTVDRTAVAGSDYTAVSGVLAFGEDETTKQVTVPLLGDGDVEGAETFGIELGPVSNGAVLLEPAHTVEIADDDVPPPTPEPPATPAPPPLQFLTATKAPRSLKALGRAKKLTVEFSCSNACAASFTLALGKKAIGTGSASLSQPGVGAAAATLSKKGRKAVSKVVAGGGETAKLRLDGSATDAAGSTATRAVKLRVPVR